MPTHRQVGIVNHPVGLRGKPRIVLGVDGKPRLVGKLSEDWNQQLAGRAILFDHGHNPIGDPEVSEIGGHEARFTDSTSPVTPAPRSHPLGVPTPVPGSLGGPEAETKVDV